MAKGWSPGDGHVYEPGDVSSGVLSSVYPYVRIDEKTRSIEFLETPSSSYKENASLKPKVDALSERWAFTNPHFRMTLPIPEVVMNAFAYKAVTLELFIGVTPSVLGNPEKKIVADPQEYDANSLMWDFQVDVGRIASLASVAVLQKLLPSTRQLRFKALINMLLYAPYPNASFDVTFRFACKSTQAIKDVVYKHHIVTDYLVNSLGLNQQVREHLPVGWSFISSGDASDDES